METNNQSKTVTVLDSNEIARKLAAARAAGWRPDTRPAWDLHAAECGRNKPAPIVERSEPRLYAQERALERKMQDGLGINRRRPVVR